MPSQRPSSAAAAAVLLAVALARGPRAAAYDNGLYPLPPLGWATWCTDDACGLLDFCNEAEVHEIADAMASSGMVAAGYKLILLDDCWSAMNRSADGNLQADPARFPSGIASLVAYVEARGAVLGLYTCAGTQTCKYSRPGSWGSYDVDAKWLAAQGVKHVKADNCFHPDGAPRDYYANFSHHLNATGVAMAFHTCEWGEDSVWEWGASVAQVFRINEDHLPFWSFNLSNGGQGIKEIIEVMANPAIGNSTQRFGYADPDFLMTGFPTISNTESETEFALWALFGGPLIIATEVRNMSVWTRSVLLNADILAVNQDALVSPGYRVRGAAGGAQLWAKDLAGGDKALVFYNAGDATTPLNISVGWAELGWPGAARVVARDLWAHAAAPGSPFVGVAGAQAVGVGPHAQHMWRLSRG